MKMQTPDEGRIMGNVTIDYLSDEVRAMLFAPRPQRVRIMGPDGIVVGDIDPDVPPVQDELGGVSFGFIPRYRIDPDGTRTDITPEGE